MKKLLALTLLCSATIGLAMDCRFPRDNAEHAEATTKTPKPDSSIFGIVYKHIASNPELLQAALAIAIEGNMEQEEAQTALLKALNFNGTAASTLFQLCNSEQLALEVKCVFLASSVGVSMLKKRMGQLELSASQLDEGHESKLKELKRQMEEYTTEKEKLEKQKIDLIATEYARMAQLMREMRDKSSLKAIPLEYDDIFSSMDRTLGD